MATTKAYSTQLSVIYLLSLYISQCLGTVERAAYDRIYRELQAIPEKIEALLTEEAISRVQYCASQYFNNRDVFYIGRNLDSATCLEGSLKLKEIAYLHSEAYAAGELKHGPISLIEDGTLVVAIATNPALFDKTMSNVKEVKARGAEVLGLTIERLAYGMQRDTDSVIAIPETDPILQPALSIIPLQCLAYYIALMRGCDVDKPRNLAKSVTVE